MLAALSTEHKIGMLVAAGAFIVFALASSFVFPRYWPQFPGSRGLTAFVVGSLALFVAMLLAVEFFAVEEEEAEAGNEPAAVAETQTGATEATTTTEPGTTTTEPGTTTTEPEATTTETTESPPTSPGPPTQTIEVSATEFAFKLSTDEVHPGVVIFRLHNDGQLGHDLALEGVKDPGGREVKTPVIDSDEFADIEIRLEKRTYELYCSVPGHRASGMEVKLEVA